MIKSVKINQNDCIGCELCAVVLCPSVFRMTSQGVAEVIPDTMPLPGDPSTQELIQECISSCPVDAIEGVE